MSTSPPERKLPLQRDLLSPLHLVVRLRLSPTATIPVRVTFRYTARRPLTVRADFSEPTGAVVTWHISRDLLLSGMHAPSGEGDIRVWPPCPPRGIDRLCIALRTPAAAALVEVDHGELSAWLYATTVRLPQGTEAEHMDWDAALAHLLGTMEP